jgi:sacsin
LPKNKIKGKRKPGVKLELSKLKNVCPDQLAPFEGLWDYQQDLDYFPGTIFRFPLRARQSKSKLRVTKKDLDRDRVRRLMGSYFQQARISLLFLRRINAIDFKIYGKSNSGWSVTRKQPVDEDFMSFSNWMVCSFTNDMDSDIPITGRDKWWVAIEDLRPDTSRLPFSPRRVTKNVESGIAALVSSISNNSNPPPKVYQPRMFSVLPLPIFSDLPIYIHATFSLSGDRQSLIVDEHGQESHGSKWNRYLLETALPKLYLSFLDDLGGRISQDVFRFWPQEDPPKRSCSEILCSAFWKELPKSSRRLFPKAQPDSVSGQRRAPELFDINKAIFDFLPNGQSDVLAPLLLSFEVKLVRHIPTEISKHLRKIPEVNYVTGSMLRKLFKLESATLLLQNEMSKNPSILETLLDLAVPVGDDLGELDGCCFLPLADGTLGTLRLLSSSITAITYYVASANEMKLFEFSSGLLLAPKAHKPFREVFKSGKFNLEKLHHRHVRKLLEKRSAPTAANPRANKWLTEFWDFWNKHPESSVPLLESDIEDCVLLQARCHRAEMYLTPSQFQELPAVVESSIEEHQLLSRKIPGLFLLNQTFMPATLKESEGSFFRINSFIRFIRAVKALAVTNGVEMGAFLKTHLTPVDLKVIFF